MKTKLLLLFALLCASSTYAQTSATGRLISGPFAFRPTCSTNAADFNAHNGDVYNDTDDGNAYKCIGGSWMTFGGGGGGGGSPAFGSITSGTNGVATMVLGSGSSLSASGTGVNAATSMPFQGLLAGTVNNQALLVGNSASLGTTGSGTIAATSVLFSGIGTGVNNSGAMTVGTGASLGVSGSGTIFATSAATAPFSGLGNGTNTGMTAICGTGCSITPSGAGVIQATNLLPTGITNAVAIAHNGGAATFTPIGLGWCNTGAVISGTTYTVAADSGTSTLDRGQVCEFSSGSAVTVTVPDPGASGTSNNYVYKFRITGAGVVTFNRTTTATFNINNGGSTISGATSFQANEGMYGVMYSPDNTNWRVDINSGGSTTPVTLTDAATVTWNIYSSESNATVTLGGARTLSIVGAQAGWQGVLKVVQDGTGSRTLALASAKVINGGGGTIGLSSTAAAVDIVTIYYDGVSFFTNIGKNYN